MDENTTLTVEFTVSPEGGGGGGFPFPLPDPDPGDDTIDVTVTKNNHVLIPNDGISLSNDGLDYTLSITPAANQTGEATISVTADDGSFSATESFVLTVLPVNDPPVAGVPADQEIDEDGELVFSEDDDTALTVSDTDIETDRYRASVRVQNGTLSVESGDGATVTGNNTATIGFSGTLAQINAALDGLVYRPTPDWNGDDTLTLSVSDTSSGGGGGGSPFPFPNLPGSGGDDDTSDSTASMTITVLPVDDTLSLDIPSEVQETGEDTALAFDAEAGNGIQVVDGDGSSGDFEVALELDAPGTLSIPEDADVTVDDDAAEDLLLQGTLPQINEALAGLTFTPDADWSGELTLSVTATDVGSSETETGEIDIRVNPMNDAPVVADEDAEITLTPIQMNTADPDGDRIADWVADLGTDADDDEGAPGIAVIAADRTNGAWEYSNDNGDSWTAFDENISEENALLLTEEARVRFVPAPDWTGVATMDFRLWDQTLDETDTTENGGTTPFSETVATASVTVTEGPPAPPLTADAGGDVDAVEGEDVSLDGSASDISDGLDADITWTQISGPSVTLEDADTLTPEFTAPNVDAEGAVLEFELSLSDNLNRTSSDTVAVRVSNSDQIRADAGTDLEVMENETVTLNAGSSFIPEEISPFYTWEQISGPSITLTNDSAAETTFIAPETGNEDSIELEFRLTISDNGDQSDSDTVTVTVNRETPAAQSPVAEAGQTQNVERGDTVTLDGTGSADADGQIVAYNWESLTDANLALSTPGQVTTTFTAPSGGSQGRTLRFRLTVTDNTGMTDTDTVSVNVSADDDIPSGPGQGNNVSVSVVEGNTVTLDAGRFGSFGAGAVYTWTQVVGEPQVTLSSPDSPTPTFVAPSVGPAGTSLQFDLNVTDAGGNQSGYDYTVNIGNNGINGFPADALPFRLFNGLNMGIKVSENGKLVRLDSIDPATLPDGPNRPQGFNHGLLGMEIRVNEPGQSVDVTVYPQSPVSPALKWFKYTEASGWEDFSDHATIRPDGTEIVISLTDGGPGDADNAANGMIVDPSGPAQGTAAPGDDGGSDDGDGDDGGCFIRSLGFRLF